MSTLYDKILNEAISRGTTEADANLRDLPLNKSFPSNGCESQQKSPITPNEYDDVISVSEKSFKLSGSMDKTQVAGNQNVYTLTSFGSENS